jgi:hypothetical protein
MDVQATHAEEPGPGCSPVSGFGHFVFFPLGEHPKSETAKNKTLTPNFI